MFVKILILSIAKRLAFALPFATALVLNLASLMAHRFQWNPQEVSRFGFLFAVPWGWLLGELPLPPPGNHTLISEAITYGIILWIPAALYAGSLWLLLAAVKSIAVRRPPPGQD
jgi:hypothetical protein